MKIPWKKAVLGIGIAGILVGGLAQPATAYTATYYNGLTEKNVQHNSGTYTNISGGAVGNETSGIADFNLTTLTWSGYGAGYTIYGKTTGTSPGRVTHTNYPDATNAQNGCYWTNKDVVIDGSNKLLCEITT